MPQTLINQVYQTLTRHSMLRAGQKVLIGLSGGPDSITLARTLIHLKEKLGILLGAAHLNHCLRGEESLRDEKFVREFAQKNGLDLIVESVDVANLAKQEKRSVEDAGRHARYDFFNKTAKTHNYDRIALGHNWDDHVEQVLMSLIRGAGPKGLKGIPPVRENRFIRPLINISKTEILAFLKEIGQDFVTDSSNEDTAYLRNRVRHRLIPFLEKEFNPDIKAGLARLSGIISLEDNFLEEVLKHEEDKIVKSRCPGKVELSVSELNRIHPALSRRLLRSALFMVKKDLNRISHTHIHDILNLGQAGVESGKSLDLPGQIRVYRKKEIICIKKEDRPLREIGRQQKADRLKTKGNSGMKT